ncbi:MAG TPA: hypothetical protein VF577_00945 [Allosphingosinicella sp.]
MAGILVGVAVIFAVEIAGHQIYPMREVDLRDSEAVAALIAALPTGAFLFVVGAWLVAAFAGGLTASLVSGRVWPAWLIGALVAAAGVANVFMFPHPTWMQLAAVIAPAIGAAVAGHVARGRIAAQSDGSA